jgi:G3E family GTPase
LDGILTLVDAKHVIEHLDEEKPEGVENEAIEQIAFADRILLNKCDLVDEATLVEVEKRIRAINEPVQLKRTTNSVVDMNFIIGIQAFSLDKILEKEDQFLAEEQEHQHDNRVSSVGVDIVGEVDSEKLNKWIGWLLSEKGVDLFRSKGILAVRGMKEKFVFQAIHMLFRNSNGDPWAAGEERRCKMIFIGRNLNREELTKGFMACIV